MSETMFRFKVGDSVTPAVEGTAFYGERGVVAEQFASDGKVLFNVEFDGKALTCFRDYHLRLVEPAPTVSECLTVDNAQTTGKQAFIQARYDCIDPLALRLVAECVGFGARKYGEENHKHISVRDHLNHAVNHILEHRIGDESEMHLIHAIARLFFAVELIVQSGAMKDRYFHPDMVEGSLKEVTSE